MLPTPIPLIKLGEPFIQLSEVDSTNNYAHNLVQNGLVQNGTAIFAQSQTQGKGQREKIWKSDYGQNIILSVIVDISTVHLQNQFSLVAMTSLACFDVFKKYAGNATAIKWTNDIYFNDNKAGGILIETLNSNDKRYAILGIGININQTIFSEDLPNATSLKLITGKTYNTLNLAQEICNNLGIYYNHLRNNEFRVLCNSYNAALYKKGMEVTLKKENIKFNCVIDCVNEFGELLVKNAVYDKFSFGTIQWVVK